MGTDELAGPTPAVTTSTSNIHALITSLTAAEVKALLLVDTNPLFTLPEAEKLKSALSSVPFIASFASFLDESAVMADLILPSHHTLERWVDDIPEPGVGFPVRTLGQPVVEPRWDTRDPGDVLMETARALGENAAAALPFENMAAAIKESFRSVHEMQVKAPALEGSAPVDADFDAFFKKVLAAGGWWASPSPLSGSRAESKGQTLRIQFVVPARPVDARLFAGDTAQMPFMLHVYPSVAFSDGRSAHLPWLQEMPDPMTTVMWGSWVEINPETARRLEVEEGDILTISSPQGTIELPAFVYPGLRPDVIAIPVGQGHTQYGRYAADRGANPLRLCASGVDETSGTVSQAGVRVSVTKTGRRERLIRFGASDARAHHEHELHR
jgi:anaerobic selenocysteine-containing dehydrogenase